MTELSNTLRLGTRASELARTQSQLVADAITARVYEVVQALGGSISAEHGIGQMKRALMPAIKSPVELAMMRAVKQALDPKGLLNPGKLLP